MKRLIPAIAMALIVVGVGAWLTLNLRAKPKYDELRDRLAQCSYSPVQMDAATTALLIEVRENWFQSHSQIDGPHSDALKTIGRRPCVSNLTHIFTYRLPEYSFFSPNQNKKSVVMGMIQSTIFPVTVDDSIHLSDDGHVAILRVRTNLVQVFSDELTGLREAMYYVKKGNIEPNIGQVSPEAAPSAAPGEPSM